MRKQAVIFLFIFLVAGVFGQVKSEVSGSDFFPLKLGQKWVYNFSDNGTESIVTHFIGATYMINDGENNVVNTIGYEVSNEGTGDKWFYFVNDGYVCSYEKIDEDKYGLTKLIPISPKVNDSWVSSGITYVITEMTGEYVRVEFMDDANDVTGYNVYKKGTGPFEMYTYRTENGLKKDTLFTLQTSPEGIKTEKEIEKEIQKETKERVKDSIVNAVNEVVAVPETDNDGFDGTYIKSLRRDYYYIQVGSFIKRENALRQFNSVREKSFDAVIYEDPVDGMFKVLVQGNSDMNGTYQRVKGEIIGSAYYKKK